MRRDQVNYTNIFMNRTPGGSGAVDPNAFAIGSQSIWMQSGPANMSADERPAILTRASG